MIARTTNRPIAIALGLLSALAWGATAAAQGTPAVDPFPHGGDGIRSRNIPIVPCLPPDRKRDVFYQNRWYDAKRPPNETHIDSPFDGGLYGRRWPASCTRSVSPFFRGYPGCSTLDEKCRPHPSNVVRKLQNFVHPFKPVGEYYAGGSYVPIYDLDPIPVGPGPGIWPHYIQRCTGG